MNQLTPAGLALLEASENDILYTYNDATGKRVLTGQKATGTLTAGRGHTGDDVIAGMTVTQELSDDWWAKDIARFETGVEESLIAPVNDNVFSALVVFAYNEGIGTLQRSDVLKAVDAGDTVKAAADLVQYNKVRRNGKLVVNNGLTIRRHNEAALMLTPVEQSAPPIIATPPEAQTTAPAAIATSLWSRLWLWLS